MESSLTSFLALHGHRHPSCTAAVKDIMRAYHSRLTPAERRGRNRTWLVSQLGREFALKIDEAGRWTVCGLGIDPDLLVSC
jgi:hypothetical protein